MHMSDALISVAVGGTMAAASTGAIGYSIKKINKMELEDHKIPMMGVMGAFIFAAQMVNFTIPVTGSSGHIGGGILLAALLGPFPALITLASVLFIQCLFFADGGLLALGCNIFNIAVIPCLFIYPIFYKPILKKAITNRRLTVASILSVVIGLQFGALAVVIETVLSGVTKLPFGAFLTLMQPIHLAIGLAEGAITAAVLCFIFHVRKEILENALNSAKVEKNGMRKILVIFAIGTILTGGVLSVFASSKPDGLEWSIEHAGDGSKTTNQSSLHNAFEELQNKTALLPDYSYQMAKGSAASTGTSFSGIVGGFFTLAIVLVFGVMIMGIKRWKQSMMKNRD